MTDCEAQLGILHWFYLEREKLKSFTSIDNRCVNIWRQTHEESSVYKAKYRYFYPLLRSGVIEFYGEGKFAASPTCIVNNEQFAVLINYPETLIKNVPENTIVSRYPGIVVTLNSVEVRKFSSESKIPQSRFILPQVLEKVFLPRVIKQWEDTHIAETINFNHFDNHWNRDFESTSTGVFRRSSKPYSERLITFDQHKWKVIPHNNENIDGFNIAVTSTKKTGWKSALKYNEKLNILSIRDPFFPILLERFLFLNTLLNFSPTYNPNNRDFYINTTDLKLLSRILG